MFPCHTCKYWTWSWQSSGMETEFQGSPLDSGEPIVRMSVYPSGSIWRDKCWHPERHAWRYYFAHVGTCLECDGHVQKHKGEL